MIPVAFTYERAASIDEAIAKLGGGGKLIAGGHSLVPLMKLRLSEPGRLVDIARIPGLAGIRENGGRIEIGATTTHHDIATSALLQDKCPMIAEAAVEAGQQRPVFGGGQPSDLGTLTTPAGDLATTTNALGGIQQSTFDELGRVVPVAVDDSLTHEDDRRADLVQQQCERVDRVGPAALQRALGIGHELSQVLVDRLERELHVGKRLGVFRAEPEIGPGALDRPEEEGRQTLRVRAAVAHRWRSRYSSVCWPW